MEYDGKGGNMLEEAGITGICWNMLDYPEICWDRPEQAGIRLNILEWA